MTLSLKVLDGGGNTLAVASGEDFVDLVYAAAYNEGDTIELQCSEKPAFIRWSVDDALKEGLVYVTDTVKYDVPFGEARISCSPKVFSGNRHYIYAEVADEAIVKCYRNLALNPIDQHKEVTCFPHASANIETRGESVFAAKNAIDGVKANLSHGEWPYESWGINRDPEACMRIDFGREVTIDKIVLYLRSDFPHDSYWTKATFRFSDGSEEVIELTKSSKAQKFDIKKRTIEWLTFSDLIKADDASPFPALSQIEVYGTEAEE